MEERGYPFEFSVVMAVYNVEPFLREAVDSLIAQDFGFEHIQLIMVDDGSTDGSGPICDEYVEQYPDNVMVIHKGNGGVSSARNEGLKHIQGRYVTFLDPDDKLSLNTMSCVFKFFIKEEQCVDLVAIPIYFFDAVTGSHNLNYKFDQGTRVVNLYAAYKTIHMSMSCSFVRHTIAQKIQFDERLAIAEDSKEVIKILLRKQMIGVVAECKYYYRKRSIGEASAIQNAVNNKKYYIDMLKYFTIEVCEYCLEAVKYIPNFVQYSLLNDLQWKIRTEHLPTHILNETEIAEYWRLLQKSLKYFDDPMIMSLPGLNQEYQNFILSLKYDEAPQRAWLSNDVLYHYKNSNVSYFSDLFTYIDFIKINNGVLEIEGYVTSPGCDSNTTIEVGMVVNGEWTACETIEREAGRLALDKPFIRATPFRFVKKLEDEIYDLYLSCKVNEVYVKKTQFRFGKFAPLGLEYKNSYYTAEKYSLTFSNGTFHIKRCGWGQRVLLESRFLVELLKSKKRSDKKAFAARLLSDILGHFHRKETWLISDRPAEAGDNGEALFLYIAKQNLRGIRPIFVVNRDANEYERLKKIGCVVPYLSWRHKFFYLRSSIIISSQADDVAFNPFFSFFRPYRNIIVKKKYVFLQHGVIKDDLSEWLSRYRQNLALFVTSAIPERNSIISYPYYYDESQVILSGLPRYDLLYHQEEKTVTIMPTWRANLVGGTEEKTGIRVLKPNFEQSSYFEMYKKLLNSNALIEASEKYGYTIQYIVHPNMKATVGKIPVDSRVHLIESFTYKDIFAKSSLLVTDYSSVAFDFLYLRKPVIYYQADCKEFFSGSHTYKKGYFDYERDGFGEVEYDIENTVNRIIEYMKNGCHLKEKYRERIDKFFAFSDQNNCQRVYEEILKLK